ncbi:MAG TPA: glycosyltransferase [Steroidobacteraceae bacterium]|nr:glycosyltransferase [Steroidobacteraceae bacterium]
MITDSTGKETGVLHVITGLNTGGAETALCRLLESIPAAELKHSVLALSREGALSERVRASGAKLVHLNLSPICPKPLIPLSLMRLAHNLRPKVIHGWMYHGNLAASLAVFGSKVPVLWSIRHSLHDYSEEKWTLQAAIKICGWLSHQPAQIIYNSRVSSCQHEAIGYRRDKTRIIANGFDTAVFRPDAEARARIRAELGISDKDLVIGHVGRWHSVKDHPSLIQAASMFLKIKPQAVFVLVGDGVDRENYALNGLMKELEIGDRVRLCGRRVDIAAINAAVDVATCSSSAEAFPNAVGEAMACGIPCVATSVGDMNELIGDAGVLVAPRDPKALCAGWLQMADISADDRAALGERARRRIIERYSLASCTRAYLSLYEEIGSGECVV